MARVLVVGATGQLGSRVVAQASELTNCTVRALVRKVSNDKGLFDDGVEVVLGDLRDKESLLYACRDIDVVVATATVVFPKGRYSFHEDEQVGYHNLIDACTQCGVRQFVFISLAIPFAPHYLKASQTFRMKAWVESKLKTSSLDYTILKCSPFMDDYFALIGSRIPLVGENLATLNRATGMTGALRKWFGASIEKYGFGVAPGPLKNRHSFVAVKDVAAYVCAMIKNPAAYRKTFDVGGPVALSWNELGELYASLLRKRVAMRSLPLPLLRLLVSLTWPFSEAASNQTSILWVLGKGETNFDSNKLASHFGIHLTDARDYLEQKLCLAQRTPGFLKGVA